MASLDYERCKRTFVSTATATAGTTEVLSPIVDMEGFDELTYQVVFGDNTSGSVITMVPKENTANSSSSPTPTAIDLTLGSSAAALGTAAVITSGDLVVTAGASDTDHKIVLITIKKSSMSKRYHFLSVTPATQNAAILSITVEQKSARVMAVTQSTSVIATAYAAT